MTYLNSVSTFGSNDTTGMAEAGGLSTDQSTLSQPGRADYAHQFTTHPRPLTPPIFSPAVVPLEGEEKKEATYA